jgi:hypothetical protein
MKFLTRKLKRSLASSVLFVLALPAYGQQPTFTPAVNPTYLNGYAPQSLPRAQATPTGTEYTVPPTSEQAPPQATTQVSDTQQDPNINGVLQTAFTAKTQDTPQPALPTVVQQFAKSYEAPAPTVQVAKSYEAPAPMPAVQASAKSSVASASLVQQTANSCDATSVNPSAQPAVTPCTQPAIPCTQPASPCCDSPFDRHCGVFGEFLYLRAFDVDMAHGIQQNGVGGLGTAPAGDVGTAQPKFEPAYRVGFDWACSCTSDVRFTYTWFQSQTSDMLLAAPGIGGTAASLVLFPNTVTAASTFDSLFATYNINFQTADIDYCFLLDRSDYSAWNLSVGARYAHLEQDFSQLGVFSGATGSEHTFTTIGFDGVGLRTGIDGQREFGKSRVLLYGKCFLNCLFGDFSSRYTQFNVITSTTEATSHWVDARVMPILETEVGLRWVSCDDHWKVGAGYYTSYWFNAVDTAEFIQAVQNQSFTGASHGIVFTGLVAHAEFDF